MSTYLPYACVMADPPWAYNAPLAMADGVKRASKDQYATMSVQQICDLYVPLRVDGQGRKSPGRLAGYQIADTALLGLWITAPFLIEGIHMRVCNAWGFTPRQIVPWIKGRLTVEGHDEGHWCAEGGREWFEIDREDHHAIHAKLVIQPGMGHLTRGCVEYLILATRGNYTSLVQTRSENGLLIAEEEAFIVAPKSKHSRKPKEGYAMLERLFPGPRLELFAREYREGWDAWGNELPNGSDFPAYDHAPEGPIFVDQQGVHQLQGDNTVKTLSAHRRADDDVEIIEWP